MKLSVWRQFSSNHSNAFTVVGRFASAADAEAAQGQVEAALRAIATFWTGLDAAERERWRAAVDAGALTPPEQHLYAQYDIPAGTQGLDWLWFGEARAVSGVSRYRNLLLVRNRDPGRVGRHPFDEILRRLGADVAVAEKYAGLSFVWVVDFDVADAARALWWEQQLNRTIARYQYGYFDPAEAAPAVLNLPAPEVAVPLPVHLMGGPQPTVTRAGRRVMLAGLELPMFPADLWRDLGRLEAFLTTHGAAAITFRPVAMGG